MEVVPVTAALGAEIRGVDLRDIDDGPASPNKADQWHTDVTWTAMPPAYALLHMDVKPEIGGDPNHELVHGLRTHYPPVVHPMVRTHPETGRRALLWARNFILRINELTDAENTAVLDHLEHHVNDPRPHCRWAWNEVDLAIWDERSTLHRAA